MKLRHAIAAALFCAFGSNAMAYDLLDDWPTKYKTEGGYEYGFKGLFQFDSNNFSGDTTNPATGASLFDDTDAWRRKEMNFYGKTPWGLDFNVGYDYTKFNRTKAGWIDNFVRYTSGQAGERQGKQGAAAHGEACLRMDLISFSDRSVRQRCQVVNGVSGRVGEYPHPGGICLLREFSRPRRPADYMFSRLA